MSVSLLHCPLHDDSCVGGLQYCCHGHCQWASLINECLFWVLSISSLQYHQNYMAQVRGKYFVYWLAYEEERFKKNSFISIRKKRDHFLLYIHA